MITLQFSGVRKTSLDDKMSQDRDRSFAMLFRDHALAVRRYLVGVVSKIDIAEELTQEAFARVYTSRRDDIESPRGFLFRTAHNLALDHLRRGRSVPMNRLDDRAAALVRADTPSPEECLAAREELAIVRAVIGELSPKCRQVFLLLRIEGLSYNEVAAEMGLSQTMVRKYAARALEHCHARLGRDRL